MSEKLGLTKIGESQANSLLAGDFPRVTKVVTAGASDIKTGAAVTINNTGVAETVTGDPATIKVYGVAAEDIAANGTGVVFRSGQFIGDRILVGSGTWQDWEKALPDTIFFQ